MPKLPKVKKSLYEKYQIQIDDQEKLDLENWLFERLDDARTAMHERNDIFEELRENYSVEEYDREPAFEGGSNIRIPVSRILADAIMIRLVQSHFGVQPYVRVKPQYTGLAEEARAVEKALWYVHEVSDKLMDGYLTVKDGVILGTGVCRTVWNQEWKLVNDGKKRSYVLRYNNPKTVHVPTEHFIIYPSEATDVDTATFVGHYFTKRWDELMRGVGTGLYREEWLEDLKFQATNIIEGKEGYTETRNKMKLGETGIDWKDFPYELYELIVSYDLDGDGLDEDYLITIEYHTRKIIRMIAYPATYGERWYHLYKPVPVANSLYGESLVQQIMDIDEEITTRHNQRIDNTTLVNMPMFKTVKTSPFYIDNVTLKPGAKLPVNERDDIEPLVQISPLGDNYMADEDRLMYYAQLLTGMSDLNLGQLRPGERTAYEIEASLAEGSIRIRLQVTLGMKWLKRMAWHELGLMKQFMTDDAFERITEFPNFLDDMKWEELWANYDLEPVGNSTTSNRELERQKWTLVRESLKNEPLVWDIDPMTGQMKPKAGWYEATKQWLLAHGIDDYTSIIGEEIVDAVVGESPLPGSAQAEGIADLLEATGGIQTPPGAI